MAVNYTSLAALAKRLIEENGRSVVIRRLDQGVTDANKPWRAKADVRATPNATQTGTVVFVDPVSARELGYKQEESELNTEAEEIFMAAATSFPGVDLETYHEIVDDSTIWRIERVDVLKPGSTKLLYFFVVRSKSKGGV